MGVRSAQEGRCSRQEREEEKYGFYGMEEHPALLLGESSAAGHASPLGQNGRAWARLPAFSGVTEFSGTRISGH
jgi:hypothetical protein